MKKLPKILATCAIRAAAYKDPHGGLYHVDLESGEYKLVVNWSPKIDLMVKLGVKSEYYIIDFFD